MNNKRCFSHSCLSGSSKSFRGSVPGKGGVGWGAVGWGGVGQRPNTVYISYYATIYLLCPEIPPIELTQLEV